MQKPNAEMPNAHLVLVGEVVAPFGIRGEVKVLPFMDDMTYLKTFAEVALTTEDGTETTVRVVSVRRHQGTWLLTVAGVTDRDGAERLRGARLFLRREDLPPLEEDAYYDWQLVGLRVVTEDGHDLGCIEKVHFGPANDVYETPLALIPAVADIIVRVSLNEGQIIVRNRPGLRKDDE